MPDKIVVGYDGSDSAERALKFAVEKAKARGGSLVVAHVLEWSPYSFLTPEEIEERHKRRREELARAEEALLKPVMAKLAKDKVPAEAVMKYGGVTDTLIAIATETGSSQIVIGRTGDREFSARIFGSVAGSLAQSAPVPVTIVP